MSERQLTLNEARMIREIKKRATYRRLAEVFYPEGVYGHGNQGFGEDLCKAALAVLYPALDVWASMGQSLNDRDAIENKSDVGNFFWWE